MTMETIEFDRCSDCKYFIDDQNWCDKKDKETFELKTCVKFELLED